MKYTPVIGIEIHVELATKSKMFCSCPADHFSSPPNTQTCPVCLGLPGALPVPNKKAIEWTIMLGKSLDCTINHFFKFDRKHYFYPDLPKGFQISQYDQPIAKKGVVTIDSQHGRKPIHITRVHLEEDTGKLKHTVLDGNKVSLVDFNRSGVPLVEIVSEPDITNASEAVAYAKCIQRQVRFLQISDADMEKGSMRLEANISLMESNATSLPEYKVEVKNINSFRFLKQAIEFELSRQQQLLEAGSIPDQETRGWNESKSMTITQRSKETAKDYRYFPEPDIPPFKFSDQEITHVCQQIPKLPDQYFKDFQEMGIRSDFIATLIVDPATALWAQEIFSLAKKQKVEVKKIASFMVNQKMNSHSHTPSQVISEYTQKNQSEFLDNSEVVQLVDSTIQENPDLVAKYQAGKTNVISALMGEVMKKSKGKADPKHTITLLQQQLEKKKEL